VAVRETGVRLGLGDQVGGLVHEAGDQEGHLGPEVLGLGRDFAKDLLNDLPGLLDSIDDGLGSGGVDVDVRMEIKRGGLFATEDMLVLVGERSRSAQEEG